LELKRRLDSTDIIFPMIQPPSYSEERSRTQDKRIQTVQLVIHDDPQRPWTAQELGRLVNLSPSHLRGLFKNEIGQSLSRHLKEVRMRLAMTLLTSQFLSVKEVMNRVGIFSHSHFTKDFKKAHGISPSRVIKSN
jgi:transcriptional regulator GlxA family with amidase domain